MEAYGEGNKRVVVPWKSGEDGGVVGSGLFFRSPGGKYINIFSCDMCGDLLPIGASVGLRMDFGMGCTGSLWARRSHRSGYRSYL